MSSCLKATEHHFHFAYYLGIDPWRPTSSQTKPPSIVRYILKSRGKILLWEEKLTKSI